MSASVTWTEHGKDVTGCEQYQEKLKAYGIWFKRDRSTRFTVLLISVIFAWGIFDDLGLKFGINLH